MWDQLGAVIWTLFAVVVGYGMGYGRSESKPKEDTKDD